MRTPRIFFCILLYVVSVCHANLDRHDVSQLLPVKQASLFFPLRRVQSGLSTKNFQPLAATLREDPVTKGPNTKRRSLSQRLALAVEAATPATGLLAHRTVFPEPPHGSRRLVDSAIIDACIASAKHDLGLTTSFDTWCEDKPGWMCFLTGFLRGGARYVVDGVKDAAALVKTVVDFINSVIDRYKETFDAMNKAWGRLKALFQQVKDLSNGEWDCGEGQEDDTRLLTDGAPQCHAMTAFLHIGKTGVQVIGELRTVFVNLAAIMNFDVEEDSPKALKEGGVGLIMGTITMTGEVLTSIKQIVGHLLKLVPGEAAKFGFTKLHGFLPKDSPAQAAVFRIITFIGNRTCEVCETVKRFVIGLVNDLMCMVYSFADPFLAGFYLGYLTGVLVEAFFSGGTTLVGKAGAKVAIRKSGKLVNTIKLPRRAVNRIKKKTMVKVMRGSPAIRKIARTHFKLSKKLRDKLEPYLDVYTALNPEKSYMNPIECDDGSGIPCCGHGTVVSAYGSILETCRCDPGYSPPTCEETFD